MEVWGAALEAKELEVGGGAGRASVVRWVGHIVRRFLGSYKQLEFHEAWLCPGPGCHPLTQVGDVRDVPVVPASEFALTVNTPPDDGHSCEAEGCWHMIGMGHALERVEVAGGAGAVCSSCNNAPCFDLN